ncbi:MAG TPA: cell division protein FtsQ/DivIB [Candidatus Polarisedimenticolia bacterium]|jgi:cell division septal protein FtsQ|nr:cell division protein FtsQ/DivIB [Candidatus Polarisedimenticolia bacterium]
MDLKRRRIATNTREAARSAGAEPLRILRRGRGGQVLRRRRFRSGLLLAVPLCALAVLGGAAWGARRYVRHSPRFLLRRIDFSETRYASAGELRRVLQRHLGRNIFRLDPARLGRDLEERRWVKRAVVKRVLPDGLFCAIEERVPRGLAALRDRVWLVDGEGVPIDPYGGQTQDYSLPIFIGIDERNPDRMRRQMARGVALVEYLQASYPSLAKEVSEVDLTRDDRMDLRMNKGGAAVRLDPVDFGENLDRYLTLRDYLATDFGDGAYVDLRFKDRIVFRPLVASNSNRGD